VIILVLEGAPEAILPSLEQFLSQQRDAKSRDTTGKTLFAVEGWLQKGTLGSTCVALECNTPRPCPVVSMHGHCFGVVKSEQSEQSEGGKIINGKDSIKRAFQAFFLNQNGQHGKPDGDPEYCSGNVHDSNTNRKRKRDVTPSVSPSPEITSPESDMPHDVGFGFGSSMHEESQEAGPATPPRFGSSMHEEYQEAGPATPPTSP
jgi:hypothetical protein